MYHSAYADSKSNDTEYLRRQVRILEDKLKRQRPAEKPYETVSNVNVQKFKDKASELQDEVKSLKEELKIAKNILQSNQNSNSEQQLYQKYQYLLNENAILKREKHDLEIQNIALKREIEEKNKQLMNENQILTHELDNLRQMKNVNSNAAKLQQNEALLTKISVLNEENMELRTQNDGLKEASKNKNKLDELQKYIQVLKSENEQLKGDSLNSSSSSSGNLRKLGESGKSTKELEKTIALMKKIIVKLQQENETLKSPNA